MNQLQLFLGVVFDTVVSKIVVIDRRAAPGQRPVPEARSSEIRHHLVRAGGHGNRRRMRMQRKVWPAVPLYTRF